jgi:hypothetical protein
MAQEHQFSVTASPSLAFREISLAERSRQPEPL